MDVLQQELLGDPLNMGYAPLIAAGDHVSLADLLNSPDPGGLVVELDVPAAAVAQTLDPQALLGMTDAERDVLRTILVTPGDVTVRQVKGLAAMLGSESARQEIFRLITRPATRAEAVGWPRGEPLHFGHVGEALAEVTRQTAPPTDLSPNKVYVRFAAASSRVTVPLSGGMIDEGMAVEVTGNPFDQPQQRVLQSPLALPDVLPFGLIGGTIYYTVKPNGGNFGLSLEPGGPPLAFEAGVGLLRFLGAVMMQGGG